MRDTGGSELRRRAEIPRTLVLTAPMRRDRSGLASRNQFAVFAALRSFYSTEKFAVETAKTNFLDVFAHL
jgi:hypothetical protein